MINDNLIGKISYFCLEVKKNGSVIYRDFPTTVCDKIIRFSHNTYIVYDKILILVTNIDGKFFSSAFFSSTNYSDITVLGRPCGSKVIEHSNLSGHYEFAFIEFTDIPDSDSHA